MNPLKVPMLGGTAEIQGLYVHEEHYDPSERRTVKREMRDVSIKSDAVYPTRKNDPVKFSIQFTMEYGRIRTGYPYYLKPGNQLPTAKQRSIIFSAAYKLAEETFATPEFWQQVFVEQREYERGRLRTRKEQLLEEIARIDAQLAEGGEE